MQKLKIILLFLIAFLGFNIESLGYTQIKSSPKNCYYIEPIFSTFDKASYPKEAWIGLYKKDAKYYDYVDMYYLKNLNDNIYATYSPNQDGHYEFRIYDDKYKLLSKSDIIKVTKRPTTVTEQVYNSVNVKPTLSIYANQSNGKLKIFVDYANIDINCHNYIGLYEKDASNTNYIELQKCPQKSSSLISFNIPKADTEYEFRLFNNDYYNLIYNSGSFKLEQLVKTQFNDLAQTHPSYKAIKYLNERGLINSFDNNTIKPNEKVTRADFAKLLYNCLELKQNTDKQYFIDLNPKNSDYKYIQATRSFINFYADSKYKYFRPKVNITREEVAYAIVKAYGLSDDDINLEIIEQFSDYKSIPAQYVKSVAIAIRNSVFGKVAKKFEPKKAVTRGELCEIFQRLMDR